jgi:hypothetical protein
MPAGRPHAELPPVSNSGPLAEPIQRHVFTRPGPAQDQSQDRSVSRTATGTDAAGRTASCVLLAAAALTWAFCNGHRTANLTCRSPPSRSPFPSPPSPSDKDTASAPGST